MTNYMGKSRLKKILFHYLGLTSPEKLQALKNRIRLAKEEGCSDALSYMIGYKFYRGSERLETYVIMDDKAFAFKIYSACDDKGNRRVNLTETEFSSRTDVEAGAVIFSGYALYDENFSPIEKAGNDKLKCYDISKNKQKEANMKGI